MSHVHNTKTWKVVANPNIGPAILNGVAVVSASDVWTVGNYIIGNTGSPSLTLTEHWDDTSWSVVPSPNVGTSGNRLSGVAVIAANDVWAVGFSGNESTQQTLIEHWDGTNWNIVPSPNIGTLDNMLSGVTAISTNDVWAVGAYIDSNASYQTLIEHWDGTNWSIVPSANVASHGNLLNAVIAVSANDIWAVGTQRIGSAPQIQQTLTEHWDGTSWSVVPSPNVGMANDVLNGVTSFSSDEVWAVGTSSNIGINTGSTLIERWNGKHWQVVHSPNVGTANNILNGVAGFSDDNMWAVGSSSNDDLVGHTLIGHGHDKHWHVVASPNVGTANNELNGVAVVPGTQNLWAVGYSSLPFQPLIEFYS